MKFNFQSINYQKNEIKKKSIIQNDFKIAIKRMRMRIEKKINSLFD